MFDDAANQEGVAPDGRGADFATGGCVGAATDAVPSTWDTRRALTPALDDTRTSSPGRAAAALDEVAVDHGAQLAAVDARYENAMDRITRDTDFLACVTHQAAATTPS